MDSGKAVGADGGGGFGGLYCIGDLGVCEGGEDGVKRDGVVAAGYW